MLLAALGVSACVYPYEADIDETAVDNIVIEGDILVGAVSYFAISRVQGLNSTYYEFDGAAEVRVEDSAGGSYACSGYSDDLGYAVDLTGADPSLEFRLVVNAGGKEYMSPWGKVEGGCVIDGVSYSIREDYSSLDLLMSIHSENGSSHFRYRYSEVWEYSSYYFAYCYYDSERTVDFPYGQVIDYPYGTNVYYCWNRENSRGINLATTSLMSEDRLVDYPFKSFGRSNEKLSILYKITLDVYPVSAESYAFYENLKSVSSPTGDLFSPIPSAMRGNIRCTEDENEIVYGYVAVVAPQSATLYIQRDGEVANFYQAERRSDTAQEQVEESRWPSYYRMGYLPVTNDPMQGCYWAKAACVDCRKNGGTKDRPEDWPNTHK